MTTVFLLQAFACEKGPIEINGTFNAFSGPYEL